MREERVEYYSEGLRINALIRRPETPPAGARGTRSSSRARGTWAWPTAPSPSLYHEVFVAAGFATVSPNYRGYGGSEGERGWILPDVQLQDLVNTVTLVETVEDLDAGRLGAYGHGGTGGGNAILLGAVDRRVRCVAAQSPIADGATWLRGMRRHHEWLPTWSGSRPTPGARPRRPRRAGRSPGGDHGGHAPAAGRGHPAGHRSPDRLRLPPGQRGASSSATGPSTTWGPWPGALSS